MNIKYKGRMYSEEKINKMDIKKMPLGLFFKANVFYLLPKILIILVVMATIISLIKVFFY